MNFAFSLFSHLSDDLQQVVNCHSNMPKSPRKEIGWLGGAIQDEQNVCHPATSQVLWKVFAVSFGQCQKQMDGLIEFGNVFFLCVCVVCCAPNSRQETSEGVVPWQACAAQMNLCSAVQVVCRCSLK